MRRIIQTAAISIGGMAFLFAGGCHGDRPSAIPATAAYKTRGNRTVTYTADQDGTIYVSDDFENVLVYSGPIHRGDRFVIDPDADRITVNDHVVFDKKIYAIDHSVYVVPGPTTMP